MSDAKESLTDLFKNQSEILDIESFDYLKIMVIGVGTIGSFLALGLNKMGFRNMILVDDDVVEPHNLATQFYFLNDVGKIKSKTLDNYLEMGEVTAYATRVHANHILDADVIFICVDSIEQRKIIFNAVLETYKKREKPKLIIDGRMNRLLFRVFTVPLDNKDIVTRYVEGLSDNEVKGECGEKGIIQNVYAVTATMIEQLKKILNGEDYHSILNADFENFSYIKTGLVSNEKRK